MVYNFIRGLTPLVQPIGLIWLALLLAMIRLARKRSWKSAGFCCLTAAGMWVIGATPFSAWLMAGLERPFARTEWASIQKADAVVMLGGLLSPSRYDTMGFEAGDTIDRALTALELVRRDKADNLVISGGGDGSKPDGVSEVKLLRQWFVAWGIPKVPLLDLGVCGNTHDEAEKVKAMAQKNGWKRIIMVSSAYHLKRSVAVFKTAGVEVIPVGCDFHGVNELDAGYRFHLIPRMRGFLSVETWLHEIMGYGVYFWLGWIK